MVFGVDIPLNGNSFITMESGWKKNSNLIDGNDDLICKRIQQKWRQIKRRGESFPKNNCLRINHIIPKE